MSGTGPHDDTPARRRDAARHLVHRDQMRESLALAKQPSLRNSALAGLQAALTVAIALPLFEISPWPHLIGFASLGALVALFGRFAPQRSRKRIVALCAMWQTLAVLGLSTVAWLGAPMGVQFLVLALACGLFYFVSVSGGFGAPGPLIFVFATGASLGTDITFQQVVERTAATAIVALLAWVICAASETWRQQPTAGRPLPVEPARPLGHRLIAAGRTSLGAAIAILVSNALGADHPVWAAMGAMAVLQGTQLHLSMNRALQRMAGTIVGALLAWLLLVQSPSVWTLIAALVLLQFLTEVVIGFNYALGQVLVTPMALLMTYLAAPSSGPGMAPERVLDTLLGAIVGMAIAVAFSSADDRKHLAERRAAGRRS